MNTRSTKIIILLVIDVLFFLVELFVGYAVGSLALVADSFHMLNDVMSLVVALYAIKLSASAADSRYSYGWHRAEILAALINGVFLLALCFSIFLEAIGRFFSPPEISNPKVVVIVGSLGLVSNIVGLFLFHDHGHDHSHDHAPPSSVASKPSSVRSSSQSLSHDASALPKSSSSIPVRKHSISRTEDAFSSLYDHPAATRAQFVQTAQEIASVQPQSLFDAPEPQVPPSTEAIDSNGTTSPDDETTPLLHDQAVVHAHGHSHSGSMNMRALVLHVLGDALGNVGVIASGLIIWLTTWQYKYLSDPIISLVITVIIFSSALPLVRSTSFILLQGVPHTVSLDQVRKAIANIEGVLSLHDLHIWQLSESKIVASVHVRVAPEKHEFMIVAAKIRGVLHHHGIHSSTIQPEYRHSGGNTNSPGQQSRNCEIDTCLLMCPADQICNPMENACCPPIPPESNA
ncbi:Cation efflux protein [Amanita muscaria]